MGTAAVTGARQMLMVVRGWRAVRWQPIVASWALAAAVLGWRIDSVADTEAAIDFLRGVAAILALGAPFVLDDGALSQVAAAPVSPAVRTTVRAAAAVVGCAAVWLTALALAQARAGIHVPAAFSLEPAALVACALAVAGAAQRHFELAEPSVPAGPAMIGLLLVLLLLPQPWAFVVPPGAGWDNAHRRWAVLLAAALMVLLASTRDPATRRAGRG
jgi:hypothetical protein